MSVNYQLKIELAGSRPTIWRRVIVPADTPFDHLHDIIQITMGWREDYAFEFKINETTVRDLDAELDMGDNPYERDIKDSGLHELVTMVNTRFTYTYNPHDRWEHQITLEKIELPDEESKYPVCIGGEGACPPDDGGGEPEGVVLFNIEEVNARLRRYVEDWEEIYDEAGKVIDGLEGNPGDDETKFEDQNSEYESLKHLRSPQDLLNDELEEQELNYWLNLTLSKEDGIEHETFTRLVNQGHPEETSRAMILEALSIEWFYDLKYGPDHLDDRYEYNLGRLPETPAEIPSLDCAVEVINKCNKGIPFAAIEYLHNDRSHESNAVIVDALNNYSDHQYCWEDCKSTPIWYALAAEGHICEALIDPVIGLYRDGNANETDWLDEQGEYLIGRLAQKFPDSTVQKVLAAMEKDAAVGGKDNVYFLFDVFYFCDIDKYKDRLIGLLKQDNISWHDMLASTVAYLQIKEGLPVLKEQVKRLSAKKLEEPSWNEHHVIELEEAIDQLERGEDLFPDVDTPLCIRRGTTWREEYANNEQYFYDDEPFQEDDFGWGIPDDFDPGREPGGGLLHQQPIVKENKTGRNDPCPCGSGKKYKKCCLEKDLRGE